MAVVTHSVGYRSYQQWMTCDGQRSTAIPVLGRAEPRGRARGDVAERTASAGGVSCAIHFPTFHGP